MTKNKTVSRKKANPPKRKKEFVDKFRSLQPGDVELTEREKRIAELTRKAMFA